MTAAVLAIVAFAAFIAMGFHLATHGEPAQLVTIESALLDRSTLIAWWLTWSCYPYVLGPIVIVLAIVAWRVPAWRSRILFSIAMLLLCWQGADFAQHLFARPRRLDWVVRHETAFSYPSSHAAISTGFYLLWAAMLWWSELPLGARAASSLALAVLAAGTMWSRLALGAHYVTDVAGGVLLGLAIVAAALAIVPVKVFGLPRGRV